MLENKIRSVLKLVLQAPLTKGLAPFSALTPVVITIVFLALGVAVLPLMLLQLSKLALIALWLSYLLYLLNGALSAVKGQVNSVNTLYDFYALRIVEFAIIFGFYLLNPGIIAWISILLLASSSLAFSSELALGILTAKSSEQVFYQSTGLLDRCEMLLLFSVMIFFPVTYGVLGIALVILLLCTAAFRMLEYQRR